jgi:demethylmenaquinone methyltransferase/2-methoxy-6-polyprenyl-1,4-benzoquinol methylase
MKKDNKESSLKSNKRFFNLWAKSYDYDPSHLWMEKFRQVALQLVDLSGKKRILDLSCGTGELLLSFYKKSGGNSELWGLDLAEEMIKKARKKLPVSMKLKIGDVHQLDFPDNYFDYVISTEAFHHYYNQPKAISEMERVTKKNGKVIIVDVNFFSDIVQRIFEFFEPGCVRVNNKKEMRELFVKAGLRNIKQGRNFMFSVWTMGEK